MNGFISRKDIKGTFDEVSRSLDSRFSNVERSGGECYVSAEEVKSKSGDELAVG